MSKKEGLATKEEFAFFTKVALDQVELGAAWKTGLKMFMPMLLDAVDNRYGDKLPEPWQTYAEDAITTTYEVMQDGVIDEQEEEMMVEKCTIILNAEIDLPLLDEPDEATAFMFMLKGMVSLIKMGLNKKEDN